MKSRAPVEPVPLSRDHWNVPVFPVSGAPSRAAPAVRLRITAAWNACGSAAGSGEAG
jgi:hypothetical protein